MDDKLVYIPNDDKQDYPLYGLKLLDTASLNQCVSKTLGTSVIYSQLSPHSF